MSLFGLDDQNLIQSVPHILIIDDDAIFRQLMIKVLQRAGYKVITAACASDGYQKAIDIKPDLIILDVIMLDTNGFEMCQRLLELPGMCCLLDHLIPQLHPFRYQYPSRNLPPCYQDMLNKSF